MNKQKELDKAYAHLDALLRDVYASQEKIIVRGEGNPDAALMLVGEAPGEQETLQRKPFVGKAGQNLTGFLEVLGLDRQDIYITNVVKFRPVKIHPVRGSLSNRPPKREEIALCYHLLLAEMRIVNPRVVATLGNTALHAVADDNALTIGAVHGRALPMPAGQGGGCIFPLYHPASIIYKRDLQQVYLQDVQALAQFLGDLP
ncbi:MAG: uracil-DNA glycosylase [Eubacteriales bacterium]|nr:uracil-DNA glycosylase [Eubacteriales bacterium]